MRQRRASRASATRVHPRPPGRRRGDPAERRAGRQLAAGVRAQKTAGPQGHHPRHNPVGAQQTAVGSGLRAVGDAEPDKARVSVLHPDHDTHRPQTWNEIDLAGLDLAKAEVSRHLPAENSPRARPAPGSP